MTVFTTVIGTNWIEPNDKSLMIGRQFRIREIQSCQGNYQISQTFFPIERHFQNGLQKKTRNF
jgi:hypothetical protein